jgi:hypothetical protein
MADLLCLGHANLNKFFLCSPRLSAINQSTISINSPSCQPFLAPLRPFTVFYPFGARFYVCMLVYQAAIMIGGHAWRGIAGAAEWSQGL